MRLALVLALALTGLASAATLTVDTGDDPDARLELRTYVLPDGTSAELVVLTGARVTVTVDEVTIVGSRLEIDVAGRLVRVVGEGSFASGDERVEGRDLEVDLEQERVRAIEAVVFTSAIDVSGDLAERLPGQVTFTDAFATPCSRCDQTIPDYGFRAERLVLYPGDRLVGYRATVVVRGVAVLALPVLVLPLASGDRQPQLLIATGTARERAEVRVRWPYVAGDAALGTFTVRYLAEVDPQRSGGLAGRVLGGAVEQDAFGFEIDHRAYDELGTAVLRIAYDPGRVPDATDPEREPVPATWSVRVAYATEPDGPSPDLDLELLRDDARTPGRWLYRAAIVGRDASVLGRVDAQGFVDSDPAVDAATPPSYAGGATPRRTSVRLRLEPVAPEALGLEPLRVTSAALDVGAFEDVANPANRRAASLGIVEGGRARVAHALILEPVTLWAGARLQADNAFDGRYYDSGERAITWRTRIGFDQAFGDAAQLALAFTRDVEEGETPFRFDAASPRARTEATGSFSARLAPWASFATNGGYVFVEARRPESVGWSPLTSRLTLFQSSPWIDASLEHRWLLGEDDLGTATARVALQGRADLAQLRASVTHVIDLQPEAGPPRTDQGSTALAWSIGVDRAVALSLDATYLAADDEGLPGWGSARAGASIGSLRAGDARPGLQVDAVLDLGLLRVTDATITARADVGPLAVRLLERIAFGDGTDPELAPRVADARIEATWTGVVALEARGFVWLPPRWLGHGDAPPAPRALSVRLADAPVRQAPRWEATWRTTVEPGLGPDGGRRDTRFEVRLGLVQERLGPVFLSVDALAEWSLADDVQPEAFLRRSAITIGADAWERVGLQGRIGYQGAYDRADEALSRSTLSIEDLTLTLRATEELFVGARVRDVWELTGTDAARSPGTVRPEVFFVWDRCCWALIGAWDASTGQVRIALTGPGGSDGVSETIDTPWTLPRAPLAGAP